MKYMEARDESGQLKRAYCGPAHRGRVANRLRVNYNTRIRIRRGHDLIGMDFAVRVGARLPRCGDAKAARSGRAAFGCGGAAAAEGLGRSETPALRTRCYVDTGRWLSACMLARRGRVDWKNTCILNQKLGPGFFSGDSHFA